MTKIYKRFLPENCNNLNTTEDFIKKLKEIKLEKDQKMVSFDITNLYPSIDTNEINQIIVEEIDKNYNNPEIKNTLITTNNLILNENYFQFNKKIYKQDGGVRIGSQVSGNFS